MVSPHFGKGPLLGKRREGGSGCASGAACGERAGGSEGTGGQRDGSAWRQKVLGQKQKTKEAVCAPQILSGASSSSRHGCERKISLRGSGERKWCQTTNSELGYKPARRRPMSTPAAQALAWSVRPSGGRAAEDGSDRSRPGPDRGSARCGGQGWRGCRRRRAPGQRAGVKRGGAGARRSLPRQQGSRVNVARGRRWGTALPASRPKHAAPRGAAGHARRGVARPGPRYGRYQARAAQLLDGPDRRMGPGYGQARTEQLRTATGSPPLLAEQFCCSAARAHSAASR